MSNINEKSNLHEIALQVKKRVRQLLSVYFWLIIGSILLFLLVLAIVASLCYETSTFHSLISFIAIAYAWLCLKFVLKPLFKIFEPKNHKGIEIKKQDNPELFAMIEEVVSKAECRLPKHVYISAECNAYVFYPSLIRNLFNGRQNLTIGLPLLLTLNKTELKAILSHEFGHFTQKSIAVKRVANLSEYVCSSIAHSLEQIDNADRDSYEAKPPFFAKFATKVMTKQYLNVAPLNGVLSRAQEFDADTYSYMIAGTDATISALSKIGYYSPVWDDSTRFLAYNIKENKTKPESVKELADIFLEVHNRKTDTPLSPAIHISSPNIQFVSRISYTNNNTHPSLKDRCDAVRLLPIVRTEWDDTPALSLFQDKVIHNVFNTLVIEYKELFFHHTTEFLKKELSDEKIKEAAASIPPDVLIPFYDRRVFFRPETQVDENENHEEYLSFPFTKSNALILREYDIAIDDYTILQRIVDENSPKRKYYYGDQLYTGTNVPLSSHKEYLKPLAEHAIDIIKHCNYWMTKKAETDDKLGIPFYLFQCAGIVTCQLSDLLDAIQSVYYIIYNHDKSTKATEYVNNVDQEIRRIMACMFEDIGEGVSRFNLIADYMVLYDEYRAAAINYFTNGKRDNDTQICEMFDLAFKVLSDYKDHTWRLLRDSWIVPELEAQNNPHK